MSELLFPINIYLADDHAIVAEGIAGILRELEQVEEVRVFPSGKALFKAVLSEKPQLIFLDINMPEWDGLSTLDLLKADYPELPCLILSMIDEKSVIEDCLQRGASGYLHKDSTKEELESAILSGLNSEVYISKEAQRILEEAPGLKQVDEWILSDPLTPRELEVLGKICEGLTSTEIAEQLFLSRRTVETHKTNLMQKFGVNTSGKLIAMAIKHRIIH